MDVREKLADIIQNSVGGCARHWAEVIADGIIAHGVTVQEWISVNEPPKERGIYQVFLWDKEMERSKVWYGQFTGYDWSVYDIYGDGMRCEVTHWMPMPQLPKGE